MKLNTEQMEAVNTTDGAVLVLAGAGSGKTRVVTNRIAHLIEKGVPSSKILGVTFTNKAAGEMRERVRQMAHHDVLISTFHSLGARILRESISYLGYRPGFTIYDDEDSMKLVKNCIKDSGLDLDGKKIRNLISKKKNGMGVEEGSDFARIYDEYQRRLFESNACDFDDLLLLTLRLFQEHPQVLEMYQDRWQYLMVDEFQDTNTVQYDLVKLLVSKHGNICVVGDPDQSIYSWRGAEVRNILDFERDYPNVKVVRLEQNYRSHCTILEASNALIGYNTNRYEKNLWSDQGYGPKIQRYRAMDERDEARFVVRQMSMLYETMHMPLKEMVVFYRTNFQSRAFEDALLSEHIPYQIVGGISFYQRKEIKDLLAYLRMVESDQDFLAFSRSMRVPKRGVGEATLEKVRLFAEGGSLMNAVREIKMSGKQKNAMMEYVEMIEKCRAEKEDLMLHQLIENVINRSGLVGALDLDPETAQERKGNLSELVAKAYEWEGNVEEPTLEGFLEELTLKSSVDDMTDQEDRVSLMTVHNGKGLEFDVVFLAGMEEDLFPHVNSRDSERAQEEERRLCYVGMTRARKQLYMSHASMRFMWGSRRRQRKSRFMDEIPGQYFAQEERKRVFEERDEFIDEIDQTQEDLSPLEIGDMVNHSQFGIGVVRSVSDGSMGPVYRIAFTSDQSEKNIVAKYANLKKL